MFKEIKKRIDAFLSEMSVKKLLLITVVSVCVLLPSILALSNVVYTAIKSSAPKETPAVTVYDTDGNELFSEVHDKELPSEDSLVRIFLSIREHLEECAPVNADTVTEKPLVVKITEGKSVDTLTCYFSFAHGSSYCVDANGQYYKIPSAYSDFFLSSSFAELLYSDATPPALHADDSKPVTPRSADWKYKAVDNSFKSATLIKTTNELLTYDVSGGISLSFDKAPDICTVTLHNGKTLVFKGNINELGGVSLDSIDASTPLTLDVSATWRETKGRLFCGTVDYRFNVIIHNRAEISASSDVLKKNGFVVIKATNVSDPSRLNLVPKDNAALPTIYFVGETAYAAIPYPDGYAEDVYSVFVSYGVSAKTFELTLDDEWVTSQDSLLEALGAIDVNKKLMQLSNNDRVFLGGSQISPEALGYIKTSDIGDSILMGASFYESPFVEYSFTDGRGVEVRSSVGGRVCITGESLHLGKYVAIDCGLGIKLWYFGLAECSVKTDDYIAAGDIIGTTAPLELGIGEGFYMMASCQDSIIDPKYLFEQMT